MKHLSRCEGWSDAEAVDEDFVPDLTYQRLPSNLIKQIEYTHKPKGKIRIFNHSYFQVTNHLCVLAYLSCNADYVSDIMWQCAYLLS